jgi:hypothetical protein
MKKIPNKSQISLSDQLKDLKIEEILDIILLVLEKEYILILLLDNIFKIEYTNLNLRGLK